MDVSRFLKAVNLFIKIRKLQVSLRNYTPRRAVMYVPGDDIRKIDKAFTLDVDGIILDCEDGVALNQKVTARKNIRDILDKVKPRKSRPYDLGVRVNSVDSDLCQDDLKSFLSGNYLPDTVFIPKIELTDHLNWFAGETKQLVGERNAINLIMYIESPIGFINLPDICRTAFSLSERHKFKPVALVFGSDDFCASIGACRTEDSLEILYARQKLVLVAKAFNLQAIDMVFINYKDLEGLKKQSEEGMRMGYTGKQVIHPGQIPVVQEAFLPTRAEIDWAEGLLKSFDEHQKSGKGAFTYQGSMIDMPTMKQARNVTELGKLLKDK